MLLRDTATTLVENPMWFRILRKVEYAQFKKNVLNTTSCLPSGACMRERLQCVIDNITSRPLCKQCLSNTVNWHKDNNVYREYCSSKCAQADNVVRSKRKATNQIKFGVDNPFSSPIIQDKIKSTLLERHGVEHPIQSPKIADKIKQTNIERYGVEYNCVSDNNTSKRRKTNNQRYGVDYPLQSTDIRNKSIDTVYDRYNTYSTLNVPEIRERQNLTRMDTYEKTYSFWKELHDEKLLRQMHLNDNMSQTIIADNLNCTQSAVSKWFKMFNIETRHTYTSKIQNDILIFLESIYSGEIIINCRSIITPQELDIVLPKLKIAIEVNGVYWHSELHGKHKNYHINKTIAAKDAGYTLIHVTDVQWITQSNIVKSRLKIKLGLNTSKIYARKTNIITPTKTQAKDFLNINHIQGSCNSSIEMGLLYDDEIVAIMTFGKSRFNKNCCWELLRFCTKLDCNVIGGASKLFKNAIRTHQLNKIISYAELTWNTGTLYNQLGFNHIHNATPNYKYFHTNSVFQLYNRIKFQKHKLKNLLNHYDAHKTEWQNMVNNGYDRIWDCGNSVWRYDNLN